MRQLVFHGPRQLAVEDAPEPTPRPDELRIAVHSVGICGSDVHGYAGVNKRRQPGMVMGHEAAGTVAERGADVDWIDPGAPVVVNPITTCGECELCLGGDENLCERRRIYGCILDLPGAYAESFVVAAANVVPFSGPAPLEWGALVEPLSVGAHAARIAALRPGQDVLVAGAARGASSCPSRSRTGERWRSDSGSRHTTRALASCPFASVLPSSASDTRRRSRPR
jgi:threonine dehydrogenase-like Zn-dependent dehydrogenase